MRRLRRAPAVLAAVLVLLTAAACAGGTPEDPWRDVETDTLTLSAGNPSGIYDAYSKELAEVVRDRSEAEVQVLESGGSIDNLENLASGRADLAFSAVDAAADAVAGRGAFGEPLQIRALARVYDDFLHLVVREDSGIRRIEDLEGRPVAVGARDSGTALIAGRLLRVAGLDTSDLDARALSIDDSIEALRRGEIEAFFWSGGLRTPALDALAEDVPFRLVPLGDLVDPLRAEFGSGYRHGTVPDGVYGLPEDVPTLAVPNLLVVGEDVSDALAHALVATLFEARGEVAESVPAAAVLDRAKAVFTEPVELHPGVLRYYRETKE